MEFSLWYRNRREDFTSHICCGEKISTPNFSICLDLYSKTTKSFTYLSVLSVIWFSDQSFLTPETRTKYIVLIIFYNFHCKLSLWEPLLTLLYRPNQILMVKQSNKQNDKTNFLFVHLSVLSDFLSVTFSSRLIGLISISIKQMHHKYMFSFFRKVQHFPKTAAQVFFC